VKRGLIVFVYGYPQISFWRPVFYWDQVLKISFIDVCIYMWVVVCVYLQVCICTCAYVCVHCAGMYMCAFMFYCIWTFVRTSHPFWTSICSWYYKCV